MAFRRLFDRAVQRFRSANRVALATFGVAFSVIAVLVAGVFLWRSPRPSVRPSTALSWGCGSRSLFAATQALALPVTEERIFACFPFPENDASFAELQNVAAVLGMEAEGRKTDVDELRSRKWMGVIHVDGKHFVTITGYDGDDFLVTETGYAGGLRLERWTERELKTRWDGNILILRRRKVAATAS